MEKDKKKVIPTPKFEQELRRIYEYGADTFGEFMAVTVPLTTNN